MKLHVFLIAVRVAVLVLLAYGLVTGVTEGNLVQALLCAAVMPIFWAAWHVEVRVMLRRRKEDA